MPLFYSGEVAGVLYYVMPYEEGHSLRERLRDNRPLPVEEALVILRDVCDALGWAPHRRLRRGSGRWRTWGMVAAGIVGAAATADLLWTWRPEDAAPLVTVPRLAVLPFQYGSDQDLESLAIGVTDNLIGALGDVPGLIVRSVGSYGVAH